MVFKTHILNAGTSAAHYLGARTMAFANADGGRCHCLVGSSTPPHNWLIISKLCNFSEALHRDAMSASLCMMANDASLCVAQNDVDFSMCHDGTACQNTFERFDERCADENGDNANFRQNAFERFYERCAAHKTRVQNGFFGKHMKNKV